MAAADAASLAPAAACSSYMSCDSSIGEGAVRAAAPTTATTVAAAGAMAVRTTAPAAHRRQ